ncbi:MAG: hypothetical protein KAS32_23630 [Candidatus Peribacteraceae bacterium]|nr:hypothetical protein [Candidatus Peribacteraceae bacterium]
MPMYFPDLKSVKRLAEDMQKQRDEAKKYKGIVPTTEEELPEGRKQLGMYLRNIWGDEIAALEVELAVDEDNYYQKLQEHMATRFKM